MNTWGFYPSDSSTFKELYHIDNHEKVMMDSGGTHKHVGRIDFKRYVSAEEVKNTVEAYMNKYTKTVMFTVKAFPVHTDESPATAPVSACPFRIDTICNS